MKPSTEALIKTMAEKYVVEKYGSYSDTSINCFITGAWAFAEALEEAEKALRIADYLTSRSQHVWTVKDYDDRAIIHDVLDLIEKLRGGD